MYAKDAVLPSDEWVWSNHAISDDSSSCPSPSSDIEYPITPLSFEHLFSAQTQTSQQRDSSSKGTVSSKRLRLNDEFGGRPHLYHDLKTMEFGYLPSPPLDDIHLPQHSSVSLQSSFSTIFYPSSNHQQSFDADSTISMSSSVNTEVLSEPHQYYCDSEEDSEDEDYDIGFRVGPKEVEFERACSIPIEPRDELKKELGDLCDSLDENGINSNSELMTPLPSPFASPVPSMDAKVDTDTVTGQDDIDMLALLPGMNLYVAHSTLGITTPPNTPQVASFDLSNSADEKDRSSEDERTGIEKRNSPTVRRVERLRNRTREEEDYSVDGRKLRQLRSGTKVTTINPNTLHSKECVPKAAVNQRPYTRSQRLPRVCRNRHSENQSVTSQTLVSAPSPSPSDLAPSQDAEDYFIDVVSNDTLDTIDDQQEPVYLDLDPSALTDSKLAENLSIPVILDEEAHFPLGFPHLFSAALGRTSDRNTFCSYPLVVASITVGDQLS
ncbi:hypothetical protein BKA69DRAFT_178889 [Paraphysoderma sedebokerense]|nr:hypothetical protein BKA69DRAFT_178889 [Paraphysoderma sedebokerense]